MMKILHVVENLNRGGLERVVIDLASMQHRRGHDVCVLCIKSRGLLATSLESNGVPVFSVDRDIIGTFVAIKKIRSFLFSFRPEVIHTHNPIPNYFIVFSSIWNKNFILINTRHGMGQYWYSKKGKILYYLSQIKTKYVVTVCDTAKKLFIKKRQIMKNKAITVKNGIFLERYKKRNFLSKSTLCNKLNLPNSVVLFGCVGRLNYVKNHKFLFNSFANILVNRKKAHLIIVGDGELRGELEALVQHLGLLENVHFLGDRDDVPELLASFDIFVMTSISEGFSIALLEACACSLPVIATNVGGNCEIIQHKKTGLLVESQNKKELVDAMEFFMNNIDKIDEFGNNAFKWLIDEATMEVMYSKYDDLYLKAMKS